MDIETSDRMVRLRERMNRDAHGKHRISPPAMWSVAKMKGSAAERRAYSLYKACEFMPVVIEPDEIIVGMRTLVRKNNPNQSPLPEYRKARPGLPWTRRNEFLGLNRRSISHNIPGFGKLIRFGLGGLIEEATQNSSKTTNRVKQKTLSSFIIACEAAGHLLQRYGTLARTLAAQEINDSRKVELEEIADGCDHLKSNAPRNLREALQLYWIGWSLIVLEVGVLVSMGRIDQILAPFWPENPEESIKAQEIIDCFVIKCNDMNEIWNSMSLINNQIMLSGKTREGADATNPVTWAFLSSLDRLNMPDPQPAVRLHDSSPPELLQEVCRLWRLGRSQLSVYNDEVFIPALAHTDISLPDARDYAIDACQDISVFGKSNFYEGELSIDMTGLLLKSMKSSSADTKWVEFLSIFKKNIQKAIRTVCKRYNRKLLKYSGVPSPLLSATLENCIENGLGFNDGGLAINHKGVRIATPVTMINSLGAIRALVYDQGVVNLRDLYGACKANWKGSKELQLLARNAPKWGNDLDEVDLLGAQIFQFTAEEIWKQRLPDGARYLCGIHQAHHVTTGHNIPATPDGRDTGEPIPPTLAPANGTATKGPTAIMKSVTKIDPLVSQWNSSLTLIFNPSDFRGDEGLGKFSALLHTWIRLRGPQLQTNVVSREMLLDAKAHPDQYRDLIVRVWGFSDRFVSLPPLYQDELIQRTPA